MTKQPISSWGRILRIEQDVIAIANRFAPLPALSSTCLPYGNGRSYGDSCLNPGGIVLKTRGLDRFIAFDPATGILRCEAGVLLSEILSLVVAQGWFLPVSPGTRFVTVGGAIANDVHGKNHHMAGTFGCHVTQFELLRSDGERLCCSPATNLDYFKATIGGLGLTGLITWAEFQLQRISNPWIDVETIRYTSLDEFFALCEESDRDYEYTVSWVDCLSKLGRGLFMRGNHAPAAQSGNYQSNVKTFPIVPPMSLVNSVTLSTFNSAYYRKQIRKKNRQLLHYEPFFYPLDGILEWNRMYGPHGFYQYQCVIPIADGKEAISALLNQISLSGLGSFLAVLKICGKKTSPGMLSFPLSGVSLAIDFPNCGEKLHRLFSKMDEVVSKAGGRLYPAKDGRMPGALFRSGYPEWQAFSKFVDPHFSSSFWRRVIEQ